MRDSNCTFNFLHAGIFFTIFLSADNFKIISRISSDYVICNHTYLGPGVMELKYYIFTWSIRTKVYGFLRVSQQCRGYAGLLIHAKTVENFFSPKSKLTMPCFAVVNTGL